MHAPMTDYAIAYSDFSITFVLKHRAGAADPITEYPGCDTLIIINLLDIAISDFGCNGIILLSNCVKP